MEIIATLGEDEEGGRGGGEDSETAEEYEPSRL